MDKGRHRKRLLKGERVIFNWCWKKGAENKKRQAINLRVVESTEEILKSNRLKREACESIKEALKEKLSADDMTIELFERIFWADTQGYLFSRRSWSINYGNKEI